MLIARIIAIGLALLLIVDAPAALASFFTRFFARKKRP